MPPLSMKEVLPPNTWIKGFSKMAVTFRDRLFSEYPIPYPLSIWGGDLIETFPLTDMNIFLETCIDELGSDLYVTDYVYTGSMTVYLPSDTLSVIGAAKLDFPFQGNRYVKVTYNKYNQTANVRFYPATLTIRRKLTPQNLDKLSGDFLVYAKCYILAKMAEKELNVLSTVRLDADNGSLDFAGLERFRETQWNKYVTMKDDIHIYTSSNG